MKHIIGHACHRAMSNPATMDCSWNTDTRTAAPDAHTHHERQLPGRYACGILVLSGVEGTAGSVTPGGAGCLPQIQITSPLASSLGRMSSSFHTVMVRFTWLPYLMMTVPTLTS